MADSEHEGFEKIFRMANYARDLEFDGTAQAFQVFAMPPEMMVYSSSDVAARRATRRNGRMCHGRYLETEFLCAARGRA